MSTAEYITEAEKRLAAAMIELVEADADLRELYAISMSPEQAANRVMSVKVRALHALARGEEVAS